MKHIRSVGPWIALLVAACAARQEPAAVAAASPVDTSAQDGVALDQAPAAWRPGIERGRAATSELSQRLRERLQQAMTTGGALNALSVCREQAPVIGAEIAAAQGLRLGRTSHRLRNPANAAPVWLRPLLDQAARDQRPAPGPRAFDLGIAVGLAQPIVTSSACLRCHGPLDGMDAGVREALARAYPDDLATGFGEGSLRGYAWAEIPLDDTSP